MNDTIYRDKAVEICERWRQRAKEHRDRDGWYMADTLLKFIKEMPSADHSGDFTEMVRPKGKWIRDRYWSRGAGMGEEYGFFYKCSMCEYEVENGYTRCGFNYCPYCGADCRGEDDE